MFNQLLHGAGLYIEAEGRAKAFRPIPEPSGADMPRGLLFLILLLLVVIGGLFLLSRSADEVPLQTIEENVTTNAAAS